jgi:hypothetical protein
MFCLMFFFMVLNNSVKALIKSDVLDVFDGVVDVGFSSDTEPESSASDVLSDEFLRKAVSEKVKGVLLSRYDFEGVLGLAEGNGELLNKFGFYGDVLKVSRVLPVAVEKTAEKEVNVGYSLIVSVVDST